MRAVLFYVSPGSLGYSFGTLSAEPSCWLRKLILKGQLLILQRISIILLKLGALLFGGGFTSRDNGV